jgi:hypothetical protein
MCTTPVLETHDFNKIFIVESDALFTGIGTVLTQEGRPLTFTRQYLSGRNLGKYKHEKGMMVILHAMHTWRSCLLGFCFQIKRYNHILN